MLNTSASVRGPSGALCAATGAAAMQRDPARTCNRLISGMPSGCLDGCRRLEPELANRDLAHFDLTNLPRDGHWKRVGEANVFRDLVAGDLPATKGLDVFLGCTRSLFEL